MTTPVPDAPKDLSRRAFAAVALVVLGLGLIVLFAVTIGGERHSFVAGAPPQGPVRLVGGQQYSIGAHDGVAELDRLGIDPDTLACTVTTASGRTRELPITAEPSTTKAIDQIATFVAPTGGTARITCDGLSRVYVDDAENAGADTAGLWLLLGSIALAVGLPLLLSVLRRRT